MVHVCLRSFAHGIQGILDGSFCIIFPAKTYKNPVRESPLYVKTAICWAVTQRVVVIPYPSLGTTYGSRLQGSRNPDVNMNIFCTERRHVSVLSVEDSQVVASCLQNRSAVCSSPPFCRISRSTRLLSDIHEAEFSQLCSFDVILLWHLTPTRHTRRNLCIDVWCSSNGHNWCYERQWGRNTIHLISLENGSMLIYRIVNVVKLWAKIMLKVYTFTISNRITASPVLS